MFFRGMEPHDTAVEVCSNRPHVQARANHWSGGLQFWTNSRLLFP
jgi:hypothetical protein